MFKEKFRCDNFFFFSGDRFGKYIWFNSGNTVICLFEVCYINHLLRFGLFKKNIQNWVLSMETQHRNPFFHLKIDKNDFLNDVSERNTCVRCKKSRKFFCYSCYVPTIDIAPLIPKVKVRKLIWLKQIKWWNLLPSYQLK